MDQLGLYHSGIREEKQVQSKTIYGKNFEEQVTQEIRIVSHCKGGKVGLQCMNHLVAQIMAIQEAEKPEEVKDMFMRVCGYLKCCIDAEFIDKESAEEVMELVCKLAASEEARLIMKGMKGE